MEKYSIESLIGGSENESVPIKKKFPFKKHN